MAEYIGIQPSETDNMESWEIDGYLTYASEVQRMRRQAAEAASKRKR